MIHDRIDKFTINYKFDSTKQQKNNEFISNVELSQRDILNIIKSNIQELEQFRLNDILSVMYVSIDNHQITLERFKSAVKQLRKQGDIFEPKEGYYKVI